MTVTGAMSTRLTALRDLITSASCGRVDDATAIDFWCSESKSPVDRARMGEVGVEGDLVGDEGITEGVSDLWRSIRPCDELTECERTLQGSEERFTISGDAGFR